MLETSLRNADGVAAKNRNGYVESIDLVNDRSGSAQINFVRIVRQVSPLALATE